MGFSLKALKAKNLKRWLTQKGLAVDELARIDEMKFATYSSGVDAWGVDPDSVKAALVVGRLIYREYFRVKTHGIDRVPEGKVLLVANHGGQIPLDGLLVSLAMWLDAKPARMTRAMVERWVPAVPFISQLFNYCGQMVGDAKNCRDLLSQGHCVLVFPEGVRGSGKTVFERYQLQRMGTGFIRMALETGAPIVPVGVIGCEEAYPSIANFKPLAWLLKAPYFPITPFFPLLGPLGLLPLPTRVSLRFGEPIRFKQGADITESDAEKLVLEVQAKLQAEIDEGLRIRGDKLFTGGDAGGEE